ncbi:MAG: hypothetical protein K0R33_834 [Mycobacterium sp.]|jgi:hypothetical protein|nr:hypothetical protein [Mycobacterium sp.]
MLLLVALTGCSVDSLIWGTEGAGVIQTTNRVIEAGQSGEAASFLCSTAEVDLGEPSDWQGLTAGEPEHFNPEYWAEQAPLEPAWNVNLQLEPERAVSGYAFPGDVFFQETEDGLCVLDVVWSTVTSSG